MDFFFMSADKPLWDPGPGVSGTGLVGSNNCICTWWFRCSWAQSITRGPPVWSVTDKYCVINHVYVCFLGKYSHYLVSYSWSQVVNYKLIWGWKMSHVGKDFLIVNKTRPSIDHTLDPYHTEILQKNIDSFRWT